jgi:hypothetical protein
MALLTFENSAQDCKGLGTFEAGPLGPELLGLSVQSVAEREKRTARFDLQ